jgi:hypothetical protein
LSVVAGGADAGASIIGPYTAITATATRIMHTGMTKSKNVA